MQLAERIRAIHTEDNTYGAPRITAELNDGASAGGKVNHKRVARVMRENNIVGYRRRRRITTTIPEPADQKVPDLLERDFTADAPNRIYVGDIPPSTSCREVPPHTCRSEAEPTCIWRR